MWKLLRRSPLDKDLRSDYPKTSPPSGGLFGPPRIDFQNCTNCQKCVAACPTTALTARPHPGEPPGTLLFLSLTNCLFCEKCQEACEEGAIQPEQTFEVAARERAPLEQIGLLPKASFAGAAKDKTRDLHPLAPPLARLEEEANGLFKRSLRVFAVNTGSCGGCEEELTAAAGPCYELARLGIDLVDSPRHADALFVTGPVTRNLAGALREVYEAVPEPRIVIAAGACAGDGNVFRGSYATLGSLDRVLPVDVYLPGCPPEPHAILHGLLLAMERAEERLQRVEYAAPGFSLTEETLAALSPPRAIPSPAQKDPAPEAESPVPLPTAPKEAPPLAPEDPAPPAPAPAALSAWDAAPAQAETLSEDPSPRHPAAEATTSSYSVSSEHNLAAVSATDAPDIPTTPPARVKTLPWMGAVTHVSLDDPPTPLDAPPQNTPATPPAPSKESGSPPKEQSAQSDSFEDIPTLSGSRLIPSLSALTREGERGEGRGEREEGEGRTSGPGTGFGVQGTGKSKEEE